MNSSKKMAKVISALAQQRSEDLTQVGAYIKIENDPWMPLSVEVIGQHLVSVAHYGIENCDLMADPEMVFFTGTIDGSWVPVSYRNDYVGTYRVATRVRDGQIEGFFSSEQKDQVRFCNNWATNLVEQGFLKKKTHGG